MLRVQRKCECERQRVRGRERGLVREWVGVNQTFVHTRRDTGCCCYWQRPGSVAFQSRYSNHRGLRCMRPQAPWPFEASHASLPARPRSLHRFPTPEQSCTPRYRPSKSSLEPHLLPPTLCPHAGPRPPALLHQCQPPLSCACFQHHQPQVQGHPGRLHLSQHALLQPHFPSARSVCRRSPAVARGRAQQMRAVSP